jgi:hypothetical protein
LTVRLLFLAGRFHQGRNADETGEAENIEQHFQPRRHVAPQSFGRHRQMPRRHLHQENVDGALCSCLFQRTHNAAAAMLFRALRFFHD